MQLLFLSFSRGAIRSLNGNCIDGWLVGTSGSIGPVLGPLQAAS